MRISDSSSACALPNLPSIAKRQAAAFSKTQFQPEMQQPLEARGQATPELNTAARLQWLHKCFRQSKYRRQSEDRKSGGWGKSVSVRVNHGGSRMIEKQSMINTMTDEYYKKYKE